MKLICFATFEEAAASLDLFKARSDSDGLYHSSLGWIAITGIGAFTAHVISTALSDSYDCLINIGLAGSLKADLEIGSLHPIAKVTKFLWHPKGSEHAKKSLGATLPEFTLKESGLTLCTLDSPLYSVSTELADACDLVDMEGYAHAFTAQALGKQCHLYKIVSDHCTLESSSQIKERLPKLSHQMAEFLATLDIY